MAAVHHTADWKIGEGHDPQSIQSTATLLYFISALCGYGAAAFVPSLTLERALFYRELSGLPGVVLATPSCIDTWAWHPANGGGVGLTMDSRRPGELTSISTKFAVACRWVLPFHSYVNCG